MRFFDGLRLSLFACALTFSASPARADILFIGMNPAPGEIKAAQVVAKERGEKVIVLPRVDAAVVDKLLAFDREELELIARVERGDHSMAIGVRVGEIANQRDQLGATVELKPEVLVEELAGLERRGVSISSVVLSGHDGNGEFWGPYGTMRATHLKAAFEKAPRLAAGVRSVALLGCYTSTVGALDTHWRAVFPNVDVIAGYEQKGPLAWRTSGHDYLKGFLRADKKIAAARGKKELQTLFRGLPSIKQLQASVANRQMHVTHAGARTFDELYAACKAVSSESPLRRSFSCHYEALPGCEDPSRDTKGGEMRRFYNELHAQEHCRALLLLDGDDSLPRGEVVLLMIFYHQIVENFLRIHRGAVEELDQWLVELGFEPLRLRDTKRTRAELMRALREPRTQLMQWGRGERPGEDMKAAYIRRARALGRLEDFDRILLRLDSFCTPAAWVDPVLRPASSCVTKPENLEQKALKAWEKLVTEATP